MKVSKIFLWTHNQIRHQDRTNYQPESWRSVLWSWHLSLLPFTTKVSSLVNFHLTGLCPILRPFSKGVIKTCPVTTDPMPWCQFAVKYWSTCSQAIPGKQYYDSFGQIWYPCGWSTWFRKRRGCDNQLVITISDTAKSFDQNKQVEAVLLDCK